MNPTIRTLVDTRHNVQKLRIAFENREGAIKRGETAAFKKKGDKKPLAVKYAQMFDVLEEELTQEQLDNRALWKQVRKNILDKGNTQSRALGMEIDLHRVEFEGYRMDLKGNTDGK